MVEKKSYTRPAAIFLGAIGLLGASVLYGQSRERNTLYNGITECVEKNIVELSTQAAADPAAKATIEKTGPEIYVRATCALDQLQRRDPRLSFTGPASP